MSVTGAAVHWWEERQLRILVLCSLAIQFLLFFFSLMRRSDMARSFRSMMWLAYLGGDAVAIYALAMLFNRHKDKGCGGSNSNSSSSSLLEVVWAPVLLIHLGGQDAFTAHNIEDNELWSRHLLTAVSQVTVAIYVFCKTWPRSGDKRLLQAAIVLFVPGVLKCFVKPWALKRASIYSLVSSLAAVKQKEGEMYQLEEYVKRAKDFVGSMEDERHRQIHKPAGTGTGTANMIREMVVDLSSSYSRRLDILEDFWGLTEERAYGFVQRGLATAFLLLYTKVKTVNVDEGSLLVQLPRIFLPWAAIGLFHHSHREAYNAIDVKITYMLLCCTAALEYCSIFAFSDQLKPGGDAGEEWPEMVAQRSFIGGYVAHITKLSSNRMRIVSLLLGCKQNQEADRCYSSRRIAGLVHRHLKDGWKQKIHDAASFRKFNDNRGHWALEGNGLEDHHHLGWSIKGPFDESVLRWHIATDLCFSLSPSSSHHTCDFYKSTSTGSNECGEELTDCKAVLCRQMSNYMAYLLLVKPEMLLPGSRRNLFGTAQEELNQYLWNEPAGLDRRESSSQQEGSGPSPPETFINEAWMIAQKLQGLGDGKKMWEVIQGVWVEMLCYSAGRCRGYLHAKALGQGGEFLSYVWLLMFHMGMETFTDKLQREDHPRRHRAAGTGNNNATTAPPSTSEQEQVPSTAGGTGASASEAHADAAGVTAAPLTSEICAAEDMV